MDNYLAFMWFLYFIISNLIYGFVCCCSFIIHLFIINSGLYANNYFIVLGIWKQNRSMALGLWRISWIPLPCVLVLCHCKWFNLCLQHYDDDFMDHDYRNFTLWMASHLFTVSGIVWFNETWRFGTFKSKINLVIYCLYLFNISLFLKDGNNAIFECINSSFTCWITANYTTFNGVYHANIINSLICFIVNL